MSGRLTEDRFGYSGYECSGCAPSNIPCADCDEDNNYLNIPSNVPESTETQIYNDSVQLASKLEPNIISEAHPCGSEIPAISFLSTGFIDAPPVSVRSLSSVPVAPEEDASEKDNTLGCTLCYEGEIPRLFLVNKSGNEIISYDGVDFLDTNTVGEYRPIAMTIPAKELDDKYVSSCASKIPGFTKSRDLLNFIYCPKFTEAETYSTTCSTGGNPALHKTTIITEKK